MPGRPILLPVHVAEGAVFKIYDNPATLKRTANVTYTLQIERHINSTRYGGLDENMRAYATQVVNAPGMICRDPLIQFPQQSASQPTDPYESSHQKAIATHKTKLLAEGTPKKTRPPPPPSPGKKSADHPDLNQDRKTAIQILNITFGLNNFQTDDSIFRALAEHFDVDIGACTSTMTTRTTAVDILVDAMVKTLRENSGRDCPVYEDILNRAKAITLGLSHSSHVDFEEITDDAVVEIEEPPKEKKKPAKASAKQIKKEQSKTPPPNEPKGNDKARNGS